MLQENVALIKEINELRREIKNLRHAGGAVKPGGPIGAGWGGKGASPKRVSKDAKEALPPPPG